MTKRGKEVAAVSGSAKTRDGIGVLHLRQGNGFGGANRYTGLATNAIIIVDKLGMLFAVSFRQNKGFIGAGVHAVPTGFAFIDINRYDVHLPSWR